MDRHIEAHQHLFQYLVAGDEDSADKQRDFYDEYLAVMDLTAEFYLQTVDTVFIKQALPKGTMTHRGVPVDLTAIRNIALLTVEGENDDISGVGQTKAAQHLCTNIPDDLRAHYLQPKVGHYGVFNGSRFRAEIAPRISDFVLTHDQRARRAAPASAKAEQPAPVAKVAAKPAKKRPQATQPQAEPAPADDLTRIAGIGPKLQADLQTAGITRLAQLARLTAKQATALDTKLGLRGRLAREDWVGQAKRLLAPQKAAAES
jgi:poly(3-hydroxybutyrate) depolymerase